MKRIRTDNLAPLLRILRGRPTLKEMAETTLILASTSPYRRALLTRVGIPFQAHPPTFNEDATKTDPEVQKRGPLALAQFLAREKAKSLAGSGRCVIGSDQLVSFDGQILGKPGTADKAIEQLGRLQGRTHELITAVAMVYNGQISEFFDRTRIQLRKLTFEEIRDYVAADSPLDCAGAYKFEKRGIALIEKLECADPTAIEGLPLIQLITHLRQLGCWPGAL